MHTAIQVVALMLMAIAVNIPMGYQRQGSRKFSPAWWFYIHISIPFIIYARIKTGLGIQFMPFTLAGAVAGQVLGGRWYRKRNHIG
ncbi:hypothetical protein [Geomonas sp.]|uniref:hypothetical protein n=1 Tax=Geomonas sp. TaxID=2651584 RepID=UPI002B46CF6E|nr:hypothetical protein [Geomonas sp.]HJV33561.1 hypothetical protein [Geomonas sp.]